MALLGPPRAGKLRSKGCSRATSWAASRCSTHRRRDGRRLDLIAATGHDRAVVLDYRAMLEHGIRTVRDGVRWHLIETMPGR